LGMHLIYSSYLSNTLFKKQYVTIRTVRQASQQDPLSGLVPCFIATGLGTQPYVPVRPAVSAGMYTPTKVLCSPNDRSFNPAVIPTAKMEGPPGSAIGAYTEIQVRING
jgi:hypothetical protein